MKKVRFINDEVRIDEHPILCRTTMVQAIVEGNKTMTRRKLKLKLDPIEVAGLDIEKILALCPYGKVGDLLWVRETFFVEQYFNGLTLECFTKYKADFEGPVAWNWKPSIFMPKASARLWLEITDIKIERLHDISEEDAKAEGCKHAYDIYQKGVVFEMTSGEGGIIHNARSFRRGFLLLWKSINGEASWNANPWVWVISFKVLSTTGKPERKEVEHA